jgi:hypothetical protein
MRHDVVKLRDLVTRDSEWMTLDAARAAGIKLDHVTPGIGPRVRGMVYLGAYWGSVNTVHEVFVKVVPPGRDPETGRFTPRRAVWWEVAEESANDHGRVRRHCTSWEYDKRNQPLFMLETSGS